MKMTLLKPTVLAASVLFALNMVACSEIKQSSMNKSFDLAGIQAGTSDGAESPKEEAEELALAAEQLAQSANFSYSLRLAKAALAVDPTNVRAKFWKATAGPIMQLKGLATRIEPLARKNNKNYRAYVQAKAELKAATPIKALNDFMFKGPKDIASEADIQETISRVTLKLDDLRKTLKEIRNEELTIYRTPESVKSSDMEQAAQATCSAKETTPNVITLENCDISKAYEVKLNSADFEAMQQAVAGMQIYVGVMNSYSLNGVIAASETAEQNGGDVFAKLVANPEFGKLRDGRTIAVLPEIASDAVLAIRSGLALQAELCGSKSEGSFTREGHLFSSGGCSMPENSIEGTLKVVDILTRGAVSIGFESNGKSESVAVDLVRFSKAPISDLRSVMPKTPVKCGEAPVLQDPTFGGLFPNGDISTILPTDSDCQ